jgi:bifunctional non-homologous end joining protein LigD
VADRVSVSVEDRVLTISNLDKVLYPETGTTKGEVLAYYRAIAPAILPHLAGRCITFRRYPDGVDGPSFFEKRCPGHRPDWVQVAQGPGDRKSPIDYCRIDDLPTLVWAANLAALELHAPMARSDHLDRPDMVVFDLDPGPPAGMTESAQVALGLASLFDQVDLRSFPKTSGSKGLQVYVPINGALTHDDAADFALAVGRLMDKLMPGKTLTTMAKAERGGKVFIDWSQNSFHKTTVAAYSLRARPRPTVSTPVSWDEIEAAAGGAELSFMFDAVLDRFQRHGDLFAPTATLHQQLPVGPATP